MRTLVSLFFILLLTLCGFLAFTLWVPVQLDEQKFVMLRPGFTTRRIARELESAGVIRNSNAFILWHYWHRHGSLKAGEYLFEKSANAIDVHSRLVRGDIYVHVVVIPEGFTIFDIAQAMQEAGLAVKEDFLKLAKENTALIADLDPEAQSLEGYLFPNTYNFTRTQSLPEMAGEMVKQFRQVAKEIGLGSDVHRVVTMASIVEKETAAPEERPTVAGVYYNRLEKGIALQADPSVIYAELQRGRYAGALHHDDMQFKSDYNTYAHTGLPPGPIGNPGKTSLEAAMHPEKNSYFYFVADGSGHHRFAATLEQHNRNVVAYRKALTAK